MFIPNTVYEGEIGAGKTLNLAFDLKRIMKWRIPVVSNTPFAFCSSGKPLKIWHEFKHPRNLEMHEIKDKCPYGGEHYQARHYRKAADYLDAVIRMKSGVIVIDEAGILFNKKYGNLPVTPFVKMIQSRKENLNFLITSQAYNLLDNVFDLVTSRVYQCKHHNYIPFVKSLPYEYNFKLKKWSFVPAQVYTQRIVSPILCRKRLSTHRTRGTGHIYIKGYRTLYPRQYIPAMNSYDTNYIIDMMPLNMRQKFKKTRVEDAFYSDDYDDGGGAAEQSEAKQQVFYSLRPKPN